MNLAESTRKSDKKQSDSCRMPQWISADFPVDFLDVAQTAQELVRELVRLGANTQVR